MSFRGCLFLLGLVFGVLEVDSLNRHDSLPVSMMWQWWVSLSSKAVVILASPKTLAHSEKLRFVVMMTLVRS